MTAADEPQAAESSARGLWQIIEVTEDSAVPRGEIQLRSTEGSIWQTVEESLARWHGMRDQSAARFERSPETALHRVRAFRTAYGLDPRAAAQVRIRPGQELTGDAELAASASPESFGRSTLPDYEQHGTVTGRFDAALPPYTQEARAEISAPLDYRAFRDVLAAAGIVPETPAKPTAWSQLAARVETALAEARAMNLAFDTGAEQCECGTWQVTWAPAYDRWLCSDCADTEAERDHELDDAASDPPNATMRGYNAHYAVFDELRRFCREDAEETMRVLTDNLPQIQQAAREVRDISREQFVRDYWRAGQAVVNPADHIRITGV